MYDIYSMIDVESDDEDLYYEDDLDDEFDYVYSDDETNNLNEAW